MVTMCTMAYLGGGFPGSYTPQNESACFIKT